MRENQRQREERRQPRAYGTPSCGWLADWLAKSVLPPPRRGMNINP